MKIMLAAAAFSSEMTGVQRHAFNVVRCLLTRPEISLVHLVVAPWQRALVQSMAQSMAQSFGIEPGGRLRIHLAPMEHTSIGRNLWYYRGLPALAAQQRADLVHLAYPAPLNPSAYTCPTIVTLHDLYPYEIPANFGFPKVLFNRMILQQCLRHASAIACVSQITAERLRQYVPAQQHKAVRIYNCVEASAAATNSATPTNLDPSRLNEDRTPILGWQAIPFLLCVAQHRRNKNVPLLIRTFAHLLRTRRIDREMKLLIVGIPGPETQCIHHAIARCQIAENVVLLDGLSEAELDWCYTHCEAVVAPSTTEGFGLPVAEALLAGCRVVCSDIPAFREVGHGCAHFVSLARNPEDALAAAIPKALAAPARTPALLPQFSARTLGAQYLDLYRKLLAAAPSAAGIQAIAPERMTG
jgi:glycosyltransferase involved in cell wall biosynthesis